MRLLDLYNRVRQKPIHIICFKLKQIMVKQYMSKSGGWKKLGYLSYKHVSHPDILNAIRRQSVWLIAENARNAVKDFHKQHPSLINRIMRLSDDITQKKFTIFNIPVSQSLEWDWHTDWRYGKHWENGSSHSFYEERTLPYDVKFPWELSRLSFLIPVMQSYALSGSDKYLNFIIETVQDWKIKNPLADSIAWVPMEASMRAINLIFLLEIFLVSTRERGNSSAEFLVTITTTLIEHGHYIWVNREYTDIPGNHYSASIVALLLIAASLRHIYPRAEKWLEFSSSEVPKQIERQFYSDGVNFEKSVAYHRLVTELFLIGSITLDRLHKRLPTTIKTILHNACIYAQSARRPDGKAVNFGDNDDATILVFNDCSSRDHGALLALGANYFNDEELSPKEAYYQLPVIWFFAKSLPIRQGTRLSTHKDTRIASFPDGGIATWRHGGNHLFIDVGEVGQCGLGGHGHNDFGSFELSIDGHAFIVDSGTYYYTGDLEARSWFRSAIAHNSLIIDDEEPAPLLGHWRIGNHAEPYNVSFPDPTGEFLCTASHKGYHRLADPVSHERIFRIKDPDFSLEIKDNIICIGKHKITRFLHFPPNAILMSDFSKNRVLMIINQVECIISWLQDSAVSIDNGWVSDHYGQREKAPVLKLINLIEGNASFSITIAKFGE